MLHLLGKIPCYVYFAGLVGATATYVLYPSSNSKNKTKTAALNGYPRGLINYKNECFMNVILQSLSASHKVTEWLVHSRSMLNKSSSVSSSSFSLLNTLASTVASINRLTLDRPIDAQDNSNGVKNKVDTTFDEDQNEIYAAHLIKRALNSHNWYIESEEHDCHEFFHLLMDVLDEEQQANKMSLSSLNYFHPSHLRDVSRGRRIKNPFHGYLACQLQCLDCNYKYPLKLESFYVLSLTLPEVRSSTQHEFLSAMSSVNLYECLNNYFKPELITEMKCENCCCTEEKPVVEDGAINNSNKKLKSKGFIKRQAIAKLPDTLCIQIQRNSWSDTGNEMVKKTNHVKFPLGIKIDNVAPGVINAQRFNSATASPASNSTFSLRQVGIGALLGGKQLASTSPRGAMSNPSTVNTPNIVHSYELRSAIVHYGTAHSGHFVSYRKPLGSSDSSEDWLQISDSDIKKVKQLTLLNSNVYMLFYDKVANVLLSSPDA